MNANHLPHRAFRRISSASAALTLLHRPGTVRKNYATEALEQRMLLATVSWDGGGDGINWTSANNWSTDSLPGLADDVTISVAASPLTQLSSGTQWINSLVCDEAIQLFGGTLNISLPSTINGVFRLSGGTLGGTGDVTLTNASNFWNEGTMNGTGKTIIASGGTLNFITNGTRQLNRVVQNDGAAAWTNGVLRMSDGTFNNNGVFSANSVGSLDCSGNGGVNAFNNTGTFQQLGSGTTMFYVNATAVNFNNSGAVDVLGGTLSLHAGGMDTGDFALASGATLSFGGFTHTLSDTSDITGSGSLTFTTGTINHAGTVNIGGTATFNGGTGTFSGAAFSVGSLSGVNANFYFNTATTALISGASALSAGTLGGTADVNFAGTLNWTGGAMIGSGKTIIASTGTLNLTGGTAKGLIRMLQNDGTATWTGGALQMNGGTFNNNGSFTANSAAMLQSFGAGGTNVFNNAGTFTKLGSGTTEFAVSTTGVSFNNSGTVDVQGGTLTLSGGVSQHVGTTLTGGTWNIETGTLNITTGSNITTNQANVTLNGVGSTFAKINSLTTNSGIFALTDGRAFNFAPVSSTFGNSGTFTVNGMPDVNVPASITFNNSGTINGDGDLTIADILNWTGGTMTGTGTTIIAAGATLNISGPGLSSSPRPLEINGSATLIAGGSRILRLGELVMGASGELDLNDNVLILDDSMVSAVRGYLGTGYASGNWNGPGINSSVAAGNPGMSLGLARGMDLYSSFPAIFEGQDIDSDAVLVKYVIAGDATFDDAVNTMDFNVLAGHFGGTDKIFAQGDFDHSGVVDSIDFTILLGQYGQTVPAPALLPAAPLPAGALFADAGIDEDETDEQLV